MLSRLGAKLIFHAREHKHSFPASLRGPPRLYSASQLRRMISSQAEKSAVGVLADKDKDYKPLAQVHLESLHLFAPLIVHPMAPEACCS